MQTLEDKYPIIKAMLPKKDNVSCQRTLGNIHIWPLKQIKKAKLLVLLTKSAHIYENNPHKLIEDMHLFIEKLGCINIDYKLFTDNFKVDKITLRGELPLKEFLYDGNVADLLYDNFLTLVYGGEKEKIIGYDIYEDKEIAKLRFRLNRSLEHRFGTQNIFS